MGVDRILMWLEVLWRQEEEDCEQGGASTWYTTLSKIKLLIRVKVWGKTEQWQGSGGI